MKTVIGLVRDRENADSARGRLRSRGLPDSHVEVLENTQQIWKHIDCSHRRSVLKDAALGVAVIGSIYTLFGMVAGFCDFAAGFPTGSCIGATVVFVVVGAFLGAFMGAFVGRAEAEKETHLYLEGVRQGMLVIFARIEENQEADVMRVLQQEGALGVRVCDQARRLPVVTNGGHPKPA